MSNDADDMEEFVTKYDRLVEQTLNRYRDEFQDPDSDWNFQDSEIENFEIAWDLAQDTYHNLFSGDLTFDIKMAEATVHKERNQAVDWGEAKRRLVQHGFPQTHDSVSDFLPSHLASWASDELINHGVASDVIRRFEQN